MSILRVNTITDKGGNTLLSSDGAGTFTPASGLATGVLANTPAFHVTRNSNQSILNATNSKIQWNNVVLDTHSCWDSSNYRFTPTVSGQYVISFTARLNSATDAEECYLYAVKNTSTHQVQAYYKNTYYNGFNANFTVQLNGTGDYIEFYIHHNIFSCYSK